MGKYDEFEHFSGIIFNFFENLLHFDVQSSIFQVRVLNNSGGRKNVATMVSITSSTEDHRRASGAS